jgi:CheY-like chemotaxis protein
VAATVEFQNLVADAYEHLYDLVHLRTHPLVDALISTAAPSRKEKAWQLHQALLDAIEELDPGPQAPTFSREWRRHRLMVLRYVQCLDPPSAAEQLAISRRHYYRVHRWAVEAIADILWDRRAREGQPTSNLAFKEDEPSRELELLRSEIARVGQTNRYVQAEDVIQGVLLLLRERLDQCGIEVHLALPSSLPDIPTDQSLLRQILLGIIGYLVERAEQATIRLGAQRQESSILLSLRVEPPTAIRQTSLVEAQEHLAAFEEMADLSGLHILTVHAGHAIVGFDVQLPTAQRTVLVVDDNEDVLMLFQRYLSPHHYYVVTAQTAQDALEKVRLFQPHAITLDLMMPERDGWDLLQTLLNQPDTQHIPILVCSVLKQQRDLALSLGATAFLSKPITEQALVTALETLGEGS